MTFGRDLLTARDMQREEWELKETYVNNDCHMEHVNKLWQGKPNACVHGNIGIADERTDMTKLIVAFSNSANAHTIRFCMWACVRGCRVLYIYRLV